MEDLLTVFNYIQGEQTGPDSSQRCTVVGQEAEVQIETKEILIRHKEKKINHCEGSQTLKGDAQRGCKTPILRDIQKSPKQLDLWSYFELGLGLDHSWKSFPT